MIKSHSKFLLIVLLMFTFYTSANSKDNVVSFLLIGDSGYHLDYLKPKDYYKRAKTEQQGQADAFARWNRKGRSFEGVKFPRFTYVPEIGGFVQASGLYPSAAGMQAFCDNNDCDFAVMLGDNIYDAGATMGKDGRDDNKRFEDMFTKPFSNLGNDVDDFQIYVTLGNHDWGTSREGAMLQVKFHEDDPKFYMDGLFYSVKPPAGNGDVELFIVDTEMLKASSKIYRMSFDDKGFEKRTNKLRPQADFKKAKTKEEKNMLKWLEQAMKESTAKWKFIVAHHPLWSSSGDKSQDNYTMRELLLPTACKYADAYFAGHDHTLEINLDTCETVLGRKSEQPLVHIISGAVAKLRPISTRYVKAQQKQYPQRKDIKVIGMEFGFAHMELDGDQAKVKLITVPYEGPVGMEEVFEYSFKNRK